MWIASSFQPSVSICLRFELFLCERSEPKRASLSRFFSSILGTRIQGGRDAWTRPVAPPLRRRSIVASRALACCKHFVAHGLLSPRLFSSLPQTALTISGTASPAGRPCRRSNNAPVSLPLSPSLAPTLPEPPACYAQSLLASIHRIRKIRCMSSWDPRCPAYGAKGSW